MFVSKYLISKLIVLVNYLTSKPVVLVNQKMIFHIVVFIDASFIRNSSSYPDQPCRSCLALGHAGLAAKTIRNGCHYFSQCIAMFKGS
jgi:hypothetical protein